MLSMPVVQMDESVFTTQCHDGELCDVWGVARSAAIIGRGIMLSMQQKIYVPLWGHHKYKYDLCLENFSPVGRDPDPFPKDSI
jgi:hypothetical protein